MNHIDYLLENGFVQVENGRFIKFYPQDQDDKINAIEVIFNKKYCFIYYINSKGIKHLQRKGVFNKAEFEINKIKPYTKVKVKRIRNYSDFVNKYYKKGN